MRPIGVVGIPEARSTVALAEAFRARGADAVVLAADRLSHEVASGTVTCGAHDVTDFAALAVKKLGDASSPLVTVRATHLAAAEAEGVPVLSGPAALAATVDRHLMTQRLGSAGIPLPDTLITEDRAAAAAFVQRMGTVIYKARYGTKGRGMRLVEAGAGLDAVLEEIAAEGGLPYYLQRFLPGVERDMGVAVCDGEVIGAYYRVRGDHPWSTTTRDGGRYESCPLDPRLERLALRATAIFGLAFTTVDIVRHDDQLYVYEVSPFGAYRGLEACGVDGAAHFAEAVLTRVRPLEERR